MEASLARGVHILLGPRPCAIWEWGAAGGWRDLALYLTLVLTGITLARVVADGLGRGRFRPLPPPVIGM